MKRTKSESLGLEFTSLGGKYHMFNLKQVKMEVSIMPLIIMARQLDINSEERPGQSFSIHPTI